MRIALAILLAPISAAAAIQPSEFVPTTEWQFVSEGVAIPGGLEIKMDLTEGGRWARIPPSSGTRDSDAERAAIVPVDVGSLDLDAFEEKAPGFDDGADIARDYGPALYAAFADTSNPKHDQAGRVLGICLRNNADAARAVANACPSLPEALQLNRRSLLIASAIVSTQDGLAFVKDSGLLKRLQKELGQPAARNIDGPTATALRKFLVNLVVSGEDGEDMCVWAAALQQAAYTSKQADLNYLAREIVEHEGEFSGLTVNCRAQPGLLPLQHELKRAEATASKLPHPMARRNHFEEL